MVYIIQFSSRIRIHPDPARELSTNLYDIYQDPSWSCSKAVYKPVWHIPLLSVQWITPDDGQRNCPKHVEIHFQNKFEKFVHLVGFIIRKFVMMHGHRNVKKHPVERSFISPPFILVIIREMEHFILVRRWTVWKFGFVINFDQINMCWLNWLVGKWNIRYMFVLQLIALTFWHPSFTFKF
jgi:hypothetical protein